SSDLGRRPQRPRPSQRAGAPLTRGARADDPRSGAARRLRRLSRRGLDHQLGASAAGRAQEAPRCRGSGGMMAARRSGDRLIDRLPAVRGRLSENAPLAPVTWFRVGGAAEIMFRPADLDDLAAFLAGKPADIPVTVIGVASNLLVRDGGVAGVVIRLGRGFVDV